MQTAELLPAAPRLRPSTVAIRRTILDDALSLMRRRFPEDLQVDGIAAEVFTSRRQLQRVFENSEYGSFRGALTTMRMRAAAHLLNQATPGQTVREVAAAVGYRQPAQFAKAFRRTFGVSPSEYRDGLRRIH
jgi:transcriptional regulator GlxA family with amidase domain